MVVKPAAALVRSEGVVPHSDAALQMVICDGLVSGTFHADLNKLSAMSSHLAMACALGAARAAADMSQEALRGAGSGAADGARWVVATGSDAALAGANYCLATTWQMGTWPWRMLFGTRGHGDVAAAGTKTQKMQVTAIRAPTA